MTINDWDALKKWAFENGGSNYFGCIRFGGLIFYKNGKITCDDFECFVSEKRTIEQMLNIMIALK